MTSFLHCIKVWSNLNRDKQMPAFLFFLFPKLTTTILSSLHGNQMWTWQRHGFPRTPFILQLQPRWSMLSEQFQDDMFDEDLEAPTHCSLDNVQNHKGSERLQGETAMLTGTRAEEHRSSKRGTREMKQLNLRKKICWNRTWGRGGGCWWGRPQ